MSDPQFWEPGCGEFGRIRMGHTMQATIQAMGHRNEA